MLENTRWNAQFDFSTITPSFAFDATGDDILNGIGNHIQNCLNFSKFTSFSSWINQDQYLIIKLYYNKDGSK